MLEDLAISFRMGGKVASGVPKESLLELLDTMWEDFG
jgi:hypothetical protein